MAALILAAATVLSCERSFDPLEDPKPQNPELDASSPTEEAGVGVPVGVLESFFYHDAPPRGRGNDTLGTPFDLVVCPPDQVVTGITVETFDQIPVALTLRCEAITRNGTLTGTNELKRIETTAAAQANDKRVLACPTGQIAVSMRGGLQLESVAGDVVKFVSSVGIECADLKAWIRGDGWPEVTMQAGRSVLGTENFVDGCTKTTGAFKGLSGRISHRFEKLGIACVGVGVVP